MARVPWVTATSNRHGKGPTKGAYDPEERMVCERIYGNWLQELVYEVEQGNVLAVNAITEELRRLYREAITGKTECRL